MPFLVSVRTGLPVQAPAYWVTASRRSWGCQPYTLCDDLRSLIFLYLWADARGVDLQDRFKSGVLLTLAEICRDEYIDLTAGVPQIADDITASH